MVVYNLNFVRIFTQHFGQALTFYRDTLGLKVLDQNKKNAYAILDTGPAKLILEEKDDTQLIGRYTGLSLTVKDIEALYNQLIQRGVKFKGCPEKQFWGGYLVDFLDIDGNIITLSSDPN